MTSLKKIAFAGLSLLSALLIYSFLFGKLFAFTPVITGFEKHELTNVILYTQKGIIVSDYEHIDTLLPPVEKFHELSFVKKPGIFLFSDSISYIRHSLSRARFCAFYNGRVFVTPWALEEAKNGKISLEIYLTHELSHSLLHQQTGLLRASRYPKWLVEGLAVYSSGQMGTTFYPGKDETCCLLKEGNYMPPAFFKTKKEDSIRLDVEYRNTFMYSEFGCIVDYLVSSYGKEMFLTYMKRLLTDSDNDRVFRQVYGKDFSTFLDAFRSYAEASANCET